MPDLTPGQIAAAIITLGAVGAVIVGAIKSVVKLWPKWRALCKKLTAALDSIVGRDEIRDSITDDLILPALPGMGVRTAHLEQQMAHQIEQTTSQVQQMRELTAVVKTLAETQARYQDHGARLDDHDAEIHQLQERVSKVELAAAERVVTKVESIAAYRAMEQALNSDPPLDADVVDEDPVED